MHLKQTAFVPYGTNAVHIGVRGATQVRLYRPPVDDIKGGSLAFKHDRLVYALAL